MTAAILSSPGFDTVTTTAANADVTSDTASGSIFVVATTTNVQPTSSQIIAGQDSTGATVPSATLTAVAGFNTLTLGSVLGGGSGVLSPATTYYVWFVQNTFPVSNIVTTSLTTLAVPVLSAPTVAAITDTTATPAVTSDTAGSQIYTVVTLANSQPSNLQIRLGQDANGTTRPNANALAVAGANPLPVFGLTAATNYWAWFVQYLTGSYSNVVSSAFTSASAPPPPPPPPPPPTPPGKSVFPVTRMMPFIGHPKSMSGAHLPRKLKRVGHGFVDGNGNPVLLRGWNYGEELLYQAGDLNQDVAAGANAVRFVARAWGPYDPPKLDGLQLGSPLGGDYSQAAWNYLDSRIMAADALGMYVRVDFDSNCGQNGNQDAPTQTFCSVGGLTGQNFFTPAGAAMRAAHINHGRMVIRKYRGKIHIVGCLVEPNPAGGYPGVFGQIDINKFYLECMNAWLAEDPNLIFAIGGTSWRNTSMQDPFGLGTVWPTDQITITTDFLDSSMAKDDGTWAASLANATTARSAQGYPIDVNQAGIQSSSDPDGSIMTRRLESFRTASGGSINWWFWEKVSKTAKSYGPWMDPSSNGTNRSYATNGATRQAIIEAAFRATPIYPS